MILDFSTIKETELERFYGGEKTLTAKMYTDANGKILYGKLAPGASIGLHAHETSSEIIYILAGNGKVLYDCAYETVTAGLCHYCPKGHTHSLMNDSAGDLVFFAAVPAQ